AGRGIEGERIEGPRGVARLLDRGEHRIGVAGRRIEVDADAMAGEVGTGPGDAGERREAVLDPADAGGAVHPRYQEIDVHGPVLPLPDEGGIDAGADGYQRRRSAASG